MKRQRITARVARPRRDDALYYRTAKLELDHTVETEASPREELCDSPEYREVWNLFEGWFTHQQVRWGVSVKVAGYLIERDNGLRTALVDAIALIDDLQSGKGQWTVDDVKRIKRFRALAVTP